MHKQQGMTLIGMLLTMAIVIMGGIVVMRVVPVYLEYYEVVSSMSSLNKLPATDFSTDPAANATILKSKLLNQLFINSTQSISEQQIVITPNDPGVFQLSIKYQVIKPLFYNISLLFDFNATQEVKISAE